MTPSPMFALPDGHPIPQLGMGLWQVDAEVTRTLVLQALEMGYRHFDTAAFYGNEQALGQALADAGIERDEVFITTKLWNDRHGDAPAALAESLDQLGLGYVDLYLIHWPVPGQDRYVETWQQLRELRDQGLTTSIGVSNFLPDHLRRLIDETGEAPAVNQIELHPTFAQRDVLAAHDELGIATQAWRPLGKGADLGTPAIIEIADGLGRTPAQVVLRWHLQQGRIVFPKTVHTERLAENFEVFDFDLTADELALIDAVDINDRHGKHPDEMI